MGHVLEKLDWTDVRYFVVVADAGSFLKAASKAGISINTLRRSIDRLEDQLGYSLFVRTGEGAKLTHEGRRLVVGAREMEKSFADVVRVASAAADSLSGPVRLAVTEGIGTYWIVPQLVRYLDDLAGTPEHTRVELQCAMRSVDIMRLEADISIQLEEPSNPDLIARRAGWLHLTTFASTDYLDRVGRPKTLADLASHRIVEQETEQLGQYPLDKIFGPGSHERMALLKTNFSSAHYWAVARGGGIGALPNYARLVGARLEHVDVGYNLRAPIWIAIHPELQKSARHRRLLDWLVDCFDARRYPWFGEKPVKPAELETMIRDSGIGGWFSDFLPMPPPSEDPERRRA